MKLLYALLIALILVVWFNPQPPTPTTVYAQAPFGTCDRSIAINTASSGRTSLVPAIPGSTIRICGYNWASAGTSNQALVSGTGATCTTGLADVTGPYPWIAQTGITFEAPVFAPTSAGLCFSNQNAIQASGVVSYSQN